MINKIVMLGIIVLSISACQPMENKCASEIEKFLEDVNNDRVEDLVGFSAMSSWNNRDDEGNRHMYRITYTNENNKIFNIPKFLNSNDSLTSVEMKNSLALELNQNLKDDQVAKMYLELISDVINDYNLKGINSRKHIGDFVEVILGTGCSVWYKDDDATLSQGYKKLFAKGYNIKPKWYILRINNHSEKMIELMEKRK